MAKKRQATTELHRCPWAEGDEYIDYHDREWGVPIHDDRLLFEFLVLEGAQAGLSWSTILNKRDGWERLAADYNVLEGGLLPFEMLVLLLSPLIATKVQAVD